MLPSTSQDAAKTAFSRAVGGLHVLLLLASSLKETSLLFQEDAGEIKVVLISTLSLSQRAPEGF